MTHAWWTAIAAGAGLAFAVAGGCADVEVLRPLPVKAGSSSSGVGASGGGGQGGGGVTPRTVIQRDPLGNVQKSNNLLWDGDFEWQIAFQDQYGWLYGSTASLVGFTLPPQALGAACHSGVKCVRLGTNGALLGIAVASEGSSLAVSLWGAPQDGDCAGLQVVLLTQSGVEGDVAIPPVSTTAEDGWCRYQAVTSERTTAQYLYVQNVGSEAIIDNAVIEPVDTAAQQLSPVAVPADAAVIDKEKAARIRAWGRAASMPRLPPPNEAKKRFREHMQKRWGSR